MPPRKPIRRRSIRLHQAVPSGVVDYRDVPICALCDSAADASVHRVPERDEMEREIAARMVGEKP